MTDELTIHTKIGDWESEYLQEERDVSTKEKVTQGAADGLHIHKLARLSVVARERQEAPADIIAPNKMLINQGAATDITRMIVRQRKKVTLENGREFDVRRWVGPVAEDDLEPGPPDVEQYELEVEGIERRPQEPADDNPGIVTALSPLAVARARRYLLNIVPNYARGRLELLAANGENVREDVGDLVKILWGIVESLE